MNRFYFPMSFGNDILQVTKIDENEFTPTHREILLTMRFENQTLIFENRQWKSILLGAGEEKAVYAVCDENNKVFALELIDERYYLNGRLIQGSYFGNLTCSGIKGKCFNEDSFVGLCFTGLVKPREFIYGFEWGRFHKNMKKVESGKWFTMWLWQVFHDEFLEFQERYKDVHDRNVMFEILPKGMGKCSASIFDINGKHQRISILLRGIDLR